MNRTSNIIIAIVLVFITLFGMKFYINHLNEVKAKEIAALKQKIAAVKMEKAKIAKEIRELQKEMALVKEYAEMIRIIAKELQRFNGTMKDETARFWADQILRNSARLRLDPYLVTAIIQKETDAHPEAVGKKFHERGLMQTRPETFYDIFPEGDIDDPVQTLKAGCVFLAWLQGLFPGDDDAIIAAYNAGPNRKDRDAIIQAAENNHKYLSTVSRYRKDIWRRRQ